MEEEEDRVGPFEDRVEDFEHLEKAVVWMQLGDERYDDDVKNPVCIVLTSEDNLFDQICKLHPFRDWGDRVYAKRAPSTNKRGERVDGINFEIEYERGWSEDRAQENMTQLQTWLLEHPSREACYIRMISPGNVVDKARKRPFPGSSEFKKMLVALKMLSMDHESLARAGVYE
jgi:hypothetical protein